MFDDYVLYLLESLHCQERANELMRAMKGEGSTGKPALRWELTSWQWEVPPYFCAAFLYPQEFSYGEWIKCHETNNEWACMYVGITLNAMMVMGSHQGF